MGLKERGLHGVEFVVSDDHAGLEGGDLRGAAGGLLAAVLRALPAERPWTTCRARATTTACRSCAGSTTGATWPRPSGTWRRGWAAGRRKYPKLCDWVEENIEETFTFYRLPREHHKHMKSTNMLERLNEEIKRRTHVVRIFPNAASCLRLVRALAVEIHEDWIEDTAT